MTYVCEECREEIGEEASTCPHCGHVGKQGKGILGVVLIILGLLFCVTIIGAIVGLPMVYFGYRLVKASGDVAPGVDVET